MKNKNKTIKNVSFSLPHKLSLERQIEAKLIAEEAILNNKIFMIQGPYSSVRSCLRERGWVEKFYRFSAHNENPNLSNNQIEEFEDLDYNDTIFQPPWKEDDGFYAYLHRLVMHKEPNLLWGIRKDAFNSQFIYNHQMLNHFSNSMFTTKVGLNNHLQESHWYAQEYCQSFYPRVYQLVKVEEKLTFQVDFIQTACVSLLKIIYSNNADNMVASADDETQKLAEIIIPDEVFTHAFNTCAHQIGFLTHNDIDWNFSHVIFPQNFEKLLSVYYSVRRYKGPVSINDISTRINQIANVLTQLKQLCPQYDIDGSKNVWILKPGAKSRGRGVMCLDTLESILEVVQSQVMTNEKKYVLQKYIETPLLIYETKFDIRQWFLVTDWNPLTVWMYKQSYLRFCSKKYSLDDLELAIHLTNNSIQKNYQNQDDRSLLLPEKNMWTSEQLEKYLQEEGGGESLWQESIYQGMKDAILSAMRCCQEDVEHRKNSFELYGADFMLDEGKHPWLIEINSSPCMTHSTEVTAALCPRVIQDTFKVVLDYKRDKSSDTGAFELIFKQSPVMVPNAVGLSMQVKGQTIPACAVYQESLLSSLERANKRVCKKWKPDSITLPTISSTYKHTPKLLVQRKERLEVKIKRSDRFDEMSHSRLVMRKKNSNDGVEGNVNNNAKNVQGGGNFNKLKNKPKKRLESIKVGTVKEEEGKETEKENVQSKSTNANIATETSNTKRPTNSISVKNESKARDCKNKDGEKKVIKESLSQAKPKIKIRPKNFSASVRKAHSRRNPLKIAGGNFEDTALCDKILAYIQHFDKNSVNRPQNQSYLQQPPFSTRLPSKSRSGLPVGNWSAFKIPHKPENLRSSSFHSASPDSNSLSNPSVTSAKNRPPVHYSKRFRTELRQAATEHTSTSDILRLTLTGKKASLM